MKIEDDLDNTIGSIDSTRTQVNMSQSTPKDTVVSNQQSHSMETVTGEIPGVG